MIDTSDSDHVEEIYGLLNLGLQGVAVFFVKMYVKNLHISGVLEL